MKVGIIRSSLATLGDQCVAGVAPYGEATPCMKTVTGEKMLNAGKDSEYFVFIIMKT